MATQPVKILCTRPVEERLIRKAERSNIEITALSFIDTSPRYDIETQQEIEWIANGHSLVVFTSMNAVDAVTGMLDGYIPDWTIYCMGYATRQRVTDYFGESCIAGTADDAATLADELVENEAPEEVVFFCGNRRREELPGKLRKQKVEVNEVVVYDTTLIQHTVNEAYDGILFFSPSAVESFFSNNRLPQTAVVFAIGETTAGEVKRYCSNKIIIATQPGKEALLAQAVDYFHEF